MARRRDRKPWPTVYGLRCRRKRCRSNANRPDGFCSSMCRRNVMLGEWQNP